MVLAFDVQASSVSDVKFRSFFCCRSVSIFASTVCTHLAQGRDRGEKQSDAACRGNADLSFPAGGGRLCERCWELGGCEQGGCQHVVLSKPANALQKIATKKNPNTSWMLAFHTVLVVTNRVQKAVHGTGVNRAPFKVGKLTRATHWTEIPCSARGSTYILIFFSPNQSLLHLPSCIWAFLRDSGRVRDMLDELFVWST